MPLNLYLVTTLGPTTHGQAVFAAPDVPTIRDYYGVPVDARLIGTATPDIQPGVVLDDYED